MEQIGISKETTVRKSIKKLKGFFGGFLTKKGNSPLRGHKGSGKRERDSKNTGRESSQER